MRGAPDEGNPPAGAVASLKASALSLHAASTKESQLSMVASHAGSGASGMGRRGAKTTAEPAMGPS